MEAKAFVDVYEGDRTIEATVEYARR